MNLSIEKGEFVSIVGYSGSGKTTLIGMASGLFGATTGQVLINGKPVTSFAPRAAIVFQNYSLLAMVFGTGECATGGGGRISGLERAEAGGQAYQVPGDGWFQERDREAAESAVGRYAAASLHRASIRDRAGVLFLDEPFGALDALTRANLQQELARMVPPSGRSVTTLMITNSVDEAILLSDRIIPLSRGPKATLGPSIPVPHDVDEDHVPRASDRFPYRVHAHS